MDDRNRGSRRAPASRSSSSMLGYPVLGDVLAFDVSELAQGLPESLPDRRIVEDADARDFGRLLRACASHLGREQQTAAPRAADLGAPQGQNWRRPAEHP